MSWRRSNVTRSFDRITEAAIFTVTEASTLLTKTTQRTTYRQQTQEHRDNLQTTDTTTYRQQPQHNRGNLETTYRQQTQQSRDNRHNRDNLQTTDTTTWQQTQKHRDNRHNNLETTYRQQTQQPRDNRDCTDYRKQDSNQYNKGTSSLTVQSQEWLLTRYSKQKIY